MPAVAENSADVANLVDDTTTTANSDIHSHPCSTASNPGPSTPEFSPSPDQRFHQRTSSGVRRTCGITAHTLTSSDSGLTADRPVLTLSLSRDSFPADSSAEDSTMSTGTCQEPPVPPPTQRSPGRPQQIRAQLLLHKVPALPCHGIFLHRRNASRSARSRGINSFAAGEMSSPSYETH